MPFTIRSSAKASLKSTYTISEGKPFAKLRVAAGESGTSSGDRSADMHFIHNIILIFE